MAGEKLKSSPADSLSWDGTNTSGFSALAGGCRGYGWGFFNKDYYGYLWTTWLMKQTHGTVNWNL